MILKQSLPKVKNKIVEEIALQLMSANGGPCFCDILFQDPENIERVRPNDYDEQYS